MPFCSNYGIPVEVTQKFCPSCGHRLGPVPTPPPLSVSNNSTQVSSSAQPTPAPQPTHFTAAPTAKAGERIVAIVPNLKKPKSFGRWDTFNLIVTERRCIFALLTNDMLTRAIKEANEQGKAQGKGFMDRWGDQMQASINYWKRYESMEPDVVLRENRENFTFDVSAVKNTKISRRERDGSRDNYWEITIETRGDKYKFDSDSDPKEPMHHAFGVR